MKRPMRVCIVSWIAVAALGIGDLSGQMRDPVPAAVIASGTAFAVDSETDPQFELIDARVDVGRLRQAGDAIEADLTWTLRLGALRDTAASYPGVTIPDGSLSVDRERIVCRKDGALSYRVGARILAPGGTLLAAKTFDAAKERAKAEDWDRQLGRSAGYGPDPRSLVCWAAARKCEGAAFTWPPPPNEAPLEYSDRAAAMRADYNRKFVPGCRLPG